jgi:polyvinyl alcohol dehydrogenase (cytochrome)
MKATLPLITLTTLLTLGACSGGSAGPPITPVPDGGAAGTTGAAGTSGAAGVAGAAGANGGAGAAGTGVVTPPDGGAGSGGAGGGTAGSGTSGAAGNAAAGTGAPADGGAAGTGAPAESQNWPMFGRDYANTRASSDTSIGAAQLASLHVAQRIVGSGVSSTPAIVDGVAYFADYAGWLKAVNAQTGAMVWATRLQTGMLTPSPFVASDTVYIAGDTSTVYAVNRMTGAKKWSTKIENTTSNRIWSSPIVVGDTLVIGAGSYQVFIPATPVFRGSIVGLRVSDGMEKWRVPVCPEGQCGGGVSVWSSVAVDTTLKLAYIGTGQAYYVPAGPYSDSLIAIRYETGERAWIQQITANDVYNINGGDYTHDRDVGASPNLFEAKIDGTMRRLVGVGDKGGHYTAFDRETGVKVWQRVTDPRTPPGSPIGGIMGAPAVASGRIFLTNNTSTQGTGRFDARPGTCTAFALDAATGAVVWSTPIPAGSFSGNTVANGLMYFVTYDGLLRVLDAGTGMLLRSVAVGTEMGGYVGDPTAGFPNGSTSGPVVANGRVYAGYGWTWGAAITGGLAIFETGTQAP